MTRVIKIGGRAQGSEALPREIAAAWARERGALCIVHGGGDEISALQRALGEEPRFAGGRRITSERDVEIVRMALSGTANKRLVARLISAGVPALGLSGEDGALVTAAPVSPALGRVGAPERVNAALLRHLLDGGYLPVVSPLARDGATADAAALNVNGDDAAAAIAVALGADELLLVADVPGVLVDGAAVPTLDADDAAAAIARGVASGGMAAKLQAGLAALRQGVERVRIGDLDAILDPTRGTVLAASRSLV
ncbi:MAG TPA: acetylglutamate kinase [Gemmatimonadaceae bacterium]|nr:acetylglutamate kinase [Gemmatimonadaceae bacterium]